MAAQAIRLWRMRTAETAAAEHRRIMAVQEEAAWRVDVGAMTARTAMKAMMPRARLTAAAM